MCGCVFISFPVSFSFFFDFCLSSSSLGNCRYQPVCCCLFLNLLREKDAVVVKVWPLCVYARTYMCIVDVSRGFNWHGVGCTALHADNRNFPIGFSRVETLSFAIERRKNILRQSTFYFFFSFFLWVYVAITIVRQANVCQIFVESRVRLWSKEKENSFGVWRSEGEVNRAHEWVSRCFLNRALEEKTGNLRRSWRTKDLEVHAYPTWPHIELSSSLLCLQLFSLSLSISLLHHTYTPLCLSLSLSVYSLFFHLSRVLSPSFSFLGLRQKELSLLRCFSPIYVEYIYIHTYIYIYTLRRASPLNAVVPLTYSYILYTLLYTRNRALSIYLSICLSIYMYTLHIYIYIYISILYIQCCHNDMCIYVYVRTCTTYTIYTCIFLYVWHCRTWDGLPNHKWNWPIVAQCSK